MRWAGSLVVALAGATMLLAVTAEPVDRAWEVLRSSMDSDNALHRAAAVSALGSSIRTPRVVSMVESGLGDKDYAVRVAAVSALAELDAKDSIPKIRQTMTTDEAPEVVFAAAKSLWQLGDQSGRQVLEEVLGGDRSTSSGMMKGYMREAKMKMHSPKALAEIGAREASGALLGPFSIGFIFAQEAMKDGGAAARSLCATMLAKDTDNSSLQPLADATGDKSPLVRAAAVKALGNRLASNGIPTIAPLLDDKHTAVRCMAAATIIKLNTIPYRGVPAPKAAPAPAEESTQ